VQVQGKLRDQIEVAADIEPDDAVAAARSAENVVRHLEGMAIVKEIYVPGRLVNFVVRPAG
jgi:leucyl-tRNA synthetase